MGLASKGFVKSQVNAIDSKYAELITSGTHRQGVWNALTNTPTLSPNSGNNGYWYDVSVEGDWDGRHWRVGDKIIFNSITNRWDQIPTGIEKDDEPMLIGFLNENSSFPTTRPSGKPLIIGDYLKVDSAALLPFEIDDGTGNMILFDSYLDEAEWNGTRFQEKSYQAGKTNEIGVNNPTLESISKSASYQNEINKEFVDEILKQCEFIDVEDVLPTENIKDNKIYRLITHEYFHGDDKLNNKPTGYKILDSENISVNSTGITIDNIVTLWKELTIATIEDLVINERLSSVVFDEADFFNYAITLFDISSNFSTKVYYFLYYNPTKTSDGYIQIGGSEVKDVRVDNQSIVNNGVANTNTNQQAVDNLFNNMPDTDALTISDLLTDEDKPSEELTDNSQLSLVDLANSKNKLFKLSQVWNYVKGKATQFIYPVGSVKFNDGSYNPQDVYGGTWSLYANGTKALYLDETAGITINEELPNLKLEVNNIYLKGDRRKPTTSPGTTLSLYNNDWGGTNSGAATNIQSLNFNANGYNSVYKDDGHVRAEGITICAWIRTA